jgi:hypothetical protein
MERREEQIVTREGGHRIKYVCESQAQSSAASHFGLCAAIASQKTCFAKAKSCLARVVVAIAPSARMPSNERLSRR